MSDLTEHAAKLVGKLSVAAGEQAVCRFKYKGVDNSARVQGKLDAHRQRYGSRYWKLRDYIGFLEANVPATALLAARMLPSQRSEDAPDA